MPKIILLSGKGKLEDFFFNALNESFGIEKVIVEETDDSRKLLKRRIKKLGVANVFGQYLFSSFVSQVLTSFSTKRIRQINREHSLNSSAMPVEKKILVKSVNEETTIELIQSMAPDIIIVNSTRIIKKKLI